MKYFIMLLVALLPITSLFAQTKQDSIDVYKKLNKWAVVKLTLAYIEDFRPAFSNDKNIEEIEINQKKEYKTYVNINAKYGDSINSESIDLNAVGDLLSNGDWKKARENIFDEYRNELVNNEIGGCYCFDDVKFIPNQVNNKSREKAIRTLQKKYKSMLSILKIEEIESDDIVVDNGAEDIPSNEESVYKTKIGSFLDYKLFFYLSLLLLVISVIFSLYLTKANKELVKKQGELKKRYSDYNSKNRDNSSPKKYDSNTKIDKLNRRIKELENELIKLKKSKSQPIIKAEEKTKKPQISTSKKVIYLPRPQEDNLFLGKHVSDILDDRYLYEVDLRNNGTVGGLTIIKNADFSRALSSPERYFEKACTYENEFTNNARSVIVVQKGEIKLQGENWVVTRKVRIKFV